jgi:hypothetical protein
MDPTDTAPNDIIAVKRDGTVELATILTVIWYDRLEVKTWTGGRHVVSPYDCRLIYRWNEP